MIATHPDASSDLMSCSQVENRTPVKHADCAFGSSRRCAGRRERHAEGDMHVFDVGPDNKLSNQKLFTDFMARVATSTAICGARAMPVVPSGRTA
jgi:hypothetical protein